MNTYREIQPVYLGTYDLNAQSLSESQRLFIAQRKSFHQQIMGLNMASLDDELTGHIFTSDTNREELEAKWEKAKKNGERVADYRISLGDLAVEALFIHAALHSETH